MCTDIQPLANRLRRGISVKRHRPNTLVFLRQVVDWISDFGRHRSESKWQFGGATYAIMCQNPSDRVTQSARNGISSQTGLARDGAMHKNKTTNAMDSRPHALYVNAKWCAEMATRLHLPSHHGTDCWPQRKSMAPLIHCPLRPGPKYCGTQAGHPHMCGQTRRQS